MEFVWGAEGVDVGELNDLFEKARRDVPLLVCWMRVLGGWQQQGQPELSGLLDAAGWEGVGGRAVALQQKGWLHLSCPVGGQSRRERWVGRAGGGSTNGRPSPVPTPLRPTSLPSPPLPR